MPPSFTLFTATLLRCLRCLLYLRTHLSHTSGARAPGNQNTWSRVSCLRVSLATELAGVSFMSLSPMASEERQSGVTAQSAPSSYTNVQKQLFCMCLWDLFFFFSGIMYCFSFSLVVGCNPVSFQEVIKPVIDRIIYTCTLSPLPLPSTDCTQDNTGKGDHACIL